jgi:hypothetical protein
MPTFTLTYADHNDPTNTRELTVDAPDDRWAMGEASQSLAQEPGQNAWVLQSITEATPVTETTGDVSSTPTDPPAVTS